MLLKVIGAPKDLEKYYRKFNKSVNKYDVSMAFVGSVLDEEP